MEGEKEKDNNVDDGILWSPGGSVTGTGCQLANSSAYYRNV